MTMKRRNYPHISQPISQEVKAFITTNGTLTGSRAFGVAEEGADFDYIMPPLQVQGRYKKCAVWDYLFENGGVYSSDYADGGFRSIYVKTEDGEVCNVLCMTNDSQYQIWFDATHAMRDLMCRNGSVAQAVKDKSNRVCLFEALREILA